MKEFLSSCRINKEKKTYLITRQNKKRINKAHIFIYMIVYVRMLSFFLFFFSLKFPSSHLLVEKLRAFHETLHHVFDLRWREQCKAECMNSKNKTRMKITTTRKIVRKRKIMNTHLERVRETHLREKSDLTVNP